MIIKKLRNLESSYNHLAIGNLALYLICLQILACLAISGGLISLESIILIPDKVVGNLELWRLFTFVAIPPLIPTSGMTLVYLLISWYVFYIIALFLENHMGKFVFNVFIFSYTISIALAAILLELFLSKSLIFVNPEIFNYGLFFMIFLGFSVLNPNYEMLLFFILPLKVKFIAMLSFGFYILSFIGSNNVLDALIHLITLVNFLLFFSNDTKYFFNESISTKSKQSINNDIPRVMHACCLCDATSEKNSELEFRYRKVDEKLVCYCNNCRDIKI